MTEQHEKPAAVGQVEPPVRHLPLVWHKFRDRMPPAEEEVLVWIDGHRGPAWRNNHALVAYCDTKGDWWEERHPSRRPLVGVIAWAHIDEPEDA